MKKILFTVLAILMVTQIAVLGASAENTVLVDESFDDYSPDYSLVKTTIFPTFIVDVNVIGNGKAVLQENPATNNLYVSTHGFSQGYTSEPVSDSYTYSMDVLEMSGGHSSIMFLRAAKTPVAFYESSECNVDGYGSACGRTGITLNLHNANTLDVTILSYDGANPNKPKSQWASFNIPNPTPGKTNIKAVDRSGRIDIYVNDELICYMELSGKGFKYKEIDVNETCYKTVNVFDAEGKNVLEVGSAIVLTKNFCVGWATRASILKFDNFHFSLMKEEIDDTSNASEVSEESSVVEESSSEPVSVAEDDDDSSPVTLICIVVMTVSVIASAVVIIIRTKKLKNGEVEEQSK